MLRPLNFLRTLLTTALLTGGIGVAALSYADDTEIFFGGAVMDEDVHPNVLFVLDNSGSMAWRTDSNTDPRGSQSSRMTILKKAFSDIIQSTHGINAGVMVLNSRSAYNNTRMVYPISYIDDVLPTSATQVAGTPEIVTGSDDATQGSDTNTARIADTSLLMGYVTSTTSVTDSPESILGNNDAFFAFTKNNVEYACRLRTSGTNRDRNSACTNDSLSELNINATNNSNNRTALFYFRALNIPANATIQSAYLELTPDNSQTSAPPTIAFKLQQSKTPGTFNDSQPIGDRTYISANITASSWRRDNTARFDISDQIRSLLQTAPTADQIGDVVVRFRATQNNDYEFCVRNCGNNNTAAPTLVVNYNASATTTSTRMGALRFQNVAVPRGATITSAKISFVPAATNSDPLTLQVRGQLSGDASAFSASENLANRTKTNALTTWSAPNWEPQNPPVPVEGPDVTPALQEIVNQSTWCGNNSAAFFLTPSAGTGTRTAYSLEGGIGLQPTLTVEYTGGSGGCLNPIIETRVTDAKNDGFEQNGSVVLGNAVLPLDNGYIAARYENLPVKQGATVLDARLIVTPNNTVSAPNVTTNIRFENTDNSSAFTTATNNFSNRSRTSSVSCSISNSTGGWVSGTGVTCSGLANTLGSVFGRSGWTPGNALTVFMQQSSNSELDARAYETNPGQSLRLRIKLADGGLSTSPNTVRNHLDAMVQGMTADDSTPVVPTLLEAVQYLRGSRDGFDSPIDSACQTTHLVLLTDGQANGNTSTAKSGIAGLTGTSCSSDASDDGEKCGRSLAQWAAKNDQAPGIEGDNYITTHTVGFALDASGEPTSSNIKTFLKDLATLGGGSSHTAESASDLSNAFNNIIAQVLATDATFVSASAPVNTFNRQDNKDELYFSVFQPKETDAWPGNLKRYRLDAATGQIVDADNVPAVDPTTGFFKSSARSFWSNSADGNDTEAGGAASQLPSDNTRKLFTFIGSSVSGPVNLNQTNYLLNAANPTITNAVLGISDASDSDARTAAINYIRGKDAKGNQRKALGDPLHSSPRLVTYACSSYTDTTYKTCAEEDQSAVLATNEGFLHLFRTNELPSPVGGNLSAGEEEFAFIPEKALNNVARLQANARSVTLRPFGMDNTVALWVNDVNKNGVIYGGRDPEATTPTLLSGLNSGEFVYAYGTMGRGGRDIYALDITDRTNPRLLWLIKGGVTPGFERLGQTWSVPVKTRINVDGTITDVLIFAGGYDPQQDNVSAQTADTMGNALYIINARTGQRIWSASNTSGHTLQLNKMLYSMPAPVRVIDLQQNSSGALVSDPDQLADQMFVGDMGGQVWRFYINNGSSGADLVTAAGSGNDGIFASVVPADSGTTTDEQRKVKLRRFYNEPDVALLNANGTLALTVNIGSGYRGHPLSKVTEDRFYSFRTSTVIGPLTNEGTLTESSLVDVTDNLVQSGSATQRASATAALSTANGGWLIKLNSNGGEKVLTRGLTVNGVLFFNTYEPTAAANSCKASVGINRSYAVNLQDATPLTSIEDNPSGSPTARFKVVKTTGLLPDPTLVTINDKSFVINGTKVDEPPQLDTSKYYWIDENNL